MTRHEADRAHEASGIAFTFAGHLVWGNPKLAEGLHGDVEAWRCGRCLALVVGTRAETDTHVEQHMTVADLESAYAALREKLDRVDAQVRTQMGEFADVVEKVDCISHGAFKPIEAVPGAVLSDQPKGVGTDQARLVNDEVREKRVAAYREAYEQGRVVWRDAATVREVPSHSAARETAEQLRADGLPE